jgi:hypothetical protein
MKTYENMTGVEIAKQITGPPVILQKNKDWTLWRGRPPPIGKRAGSRGEAGNVEAPGSPWSERVRAEE